MKLQPTTIEIEENAEHGWINITAKIKHKDGVSTIGTTVKGYSIGRKVEAIVAKIEEILKDYEKESVLDE